MSRNPIDPAEFLARTRRAWAPEATTAERVRRGLEARLAAGAVFAPSAAPVWPARMMLVGAVALVVGGIGYWAGYRAGQRTDHRAATAPAGIAAPLPRAAVPPSAVVAVASPPTIAAPAVAAPGPRRPSRGTRAGGDSASAGGQEDSSLAIELRAVRNAERALRDGSPGLALTFLHDLDRRVPHGELTEEREATGTLARCQRGDQPFGVNLGDDFTAHHPSSVYRARVEQACAGTDAAASGDSSRRGSGP